MNWMKTIATKLRIQKKDTEHKVLIFLLLIRNIPWKKLILKMLMTVFYRKFRKLSQRKILHTTCTGEGDENIQNINLKRNVHHTNDIDGAEWDLRTVNIGLCQWEKTVSVSKWKIPIAAYVQHVDLNFKNNTGKASIARKEDKFQNGTIKVRIKNHFVTYQCIHVVCFSSM
jgi:hypothetical protein